MLEALGYCTGKGFAQCLAPCEPLIWNGITGLTSGAGSAWVLAPRAASLRATWCPTWCADWDFQSVHHSVVWLLVPEEFLENWCCLMNQCYIRYVSSQHSSRHWLFSGFNCLFPHRLSSLHRQWFLDKIWSQSSTLGSSKVSFASLFLFGMKQNSFFSWSWRESFEQRGCQDTWVNWSVAVGVNHYWWVDQILSHLQDHPSKYLGTTTGIFRDPEDSSKMNGFTHWWSNNTMELLGDIKCRGWSMVGRIRSVDHWRCVLGGHILPPSLPLFFCFLAAMMLALYLHPPHAFPAMVDW